MDAGVPELEPIVALKSTKFELEWNCYAICDNLEISETLSAKRRSQFSTRQLRIVVRLRIPVCFLGYDSDIRRLKAWFLQQVAFLRTRDACRSRIFLKRRSKKANKKQIFWS